MPAAEADAFMNLLIPDQPLSYLAEPVSVTAQRWGSIPRTYVVTEHDQSIAPAVQDIMIKDADALCPGNPFRRIPVDTGHSPFAARPELLATLIGETSPR